MSALTGSVTSQEEGAMEGVLVSAKQAGSTMTITVVSNAQGQFSFPQDRLEPSTYSLTIRAAGYDLPSRGPMQVEVAAQRTSALDLNLVKTKNLAHQLSNGEWLQSFPGNEARKEALYRCVSCHTLERVANSLHEAAEMAQVVQRMGTWAQGSMPTHPQPQLGRNIGTPRPGEAALGQYISTINLSAGERSYPLKTDPRPRGKATRVIITEYDLPRSIAMPHDVQMDSRGMVWYSDFGSQYVGRLDPETGKAIEYPIPVMKPGAPTGSLDMRFDRDGMVWIGSMMQGSLVKFDPKAEKFQSWVRRTFSSGMTRGSPWSCPSRRISTARSGLGPKTNTRSTLPQVNGPRSTISRCSRPAPEITAPTVWPRTRGTTFTVWRSTPTSSSGWTPRP
jgi:hypothetical protein